MPVVVETCHHIRRNKAGGGDAREQCWFPEMLLQNLEEYQASYYRNVPRDGLVYPQIHADCHRLICVDKYRFVEKNQMVNYQLHISNRSNYDIIPGHAHSFSICFPGILCAFGILSCWFHVDLCAF